MKKAFCFDICSCHYLRQNLSSSDLRISQVTSVQKRESRKHFSASAYGLGFKKLFLGSLFSTSVTWEKVKSDVDKFCLRRVEHKYRNKILLFDPLPVCTGNWTLNYYPGCLKDLPMLFNLSMVEKIKLLECIFNFYYRNIVLTLWYSD